MEIGVGSTYSKAEEILKKNGFSVTNSYYKKGNITIYIYHIDEKVSKLAIWYVATKYKNSST